MRVTVATGARGEPLQESADDYSDDPVCFPTEALAALQSAHATKVAAAEGRHREAWSAVCLSVALLGILSLSHSHPQSQHRHISFSRSLSLSPDVQQKGA